MLSFLRPSPAANDRCSTQESVVVLWIDGVGCFWLCLDDQFSIGRPEYPSPASPLAGSHVSKESSATLAILSDLKRRHATIQRIGEGYLLEAHGPTRIADRDVSDRTALTVDSVMELGRGVRLRFRQPSALSLSACLDFVSDHRPAQAMDGVVLLADTCLLGPGECHHIDCPDWPGQVVLIRKGRDLFCRSQLPLLVNGSRLRSDRALRSGDVVATDELRFRVEFRTSTAS